MTVVHSTRWHRVAGLRPRLAPQLRVQRQRLRGETWWVLTDSAGGRSVRLNQAAYAIAARLDGRRSVQQLWEQSLQRTHDAVTQDEFIDLLAQLREAALVQIDHAADFDTLLPHLDKLAQSRSRASLLAWRIPLGNPSGLLRRLMPLQALVFSRPAWWIWLLLVASLLVLALQNAPELWAHGQHWMASPRFALLAAVLYLPVKLVHELAHGMAVRRWGGQVHEAGVTLMLLMPVPYVDASAATGFAQRRARIAVSAAGIMAELLIAALALPLWLWLDDGLARDCAFVLLVVAGVSTVLFNGNPLQRLDGYYILGDALGLPNLGPRSRAWWLDLLRRRLLKVGSGEAMPVARGETPWLLAYAPLSWLMLLLITALAVFWIAGISPPLAVAAAAVLSWQVVLRPIHQLFAQLRRAAWSQQDSARRWRRLVGASAALTALVLALPWPRATLVQGVVWPADQAQLRVEEAGFVSAIVAAPGAMLQPGDVVLQLSSPQLASDTARQNARVRALEAELLQALPGNSGARDKALAGDIRAELQAAQAALARLLKRLELLQVRAQVAGRLLLPRVDELTGQFLKRGYVLGQTVSGAQTLVRVALPQRQANDLQGLDGPVSVRLSATPRDEHRARVLHDSLGAVTRLPTAALGNRHGGDIVTDPADADGLLTREPVVVLDLQLTQPDSAGARRMGERAWVRFDGGFAPLALQLAQALQRAWARHFQRQL
ncbi:MAG: PqqD family peptide modification chaperone [Betaproteobacteria bacterium]